MISVVWLWPLINGLIGLGAVVISYILLNFLNMPHLLVATIIFAYILLIMGYNHIDGLLDFSDGVMVHGNPEKKIRVMRDSMVGTAGISTMVIVSAMTIAALNSIIDYNCLSAIIICEMSAKISLLTTCLCSKSSETGIGKYFVEGLPMPNYVAALLTVGIVSYVLLGFTGIFGVIGAILSGGLVALVAKRNFKVATGDVLGASNEYGRLLSLIFLVIILSF